MAVLLFLALIVAIATIVEHKSKKKTVSYRIKK